jgi:uncharacterized protein (TIGR01244 family)
MDNVKKINDELAIAMNQVTPEQLQQAAQEGYKSVLNLRAPNEQGFSSEEKQQAQNAGLQYVNIPVKVNEISDELADQVLEQIEQLPKPTLTHCKSGMRSGAMTLMYVATRQGMSADEALEKGKKMGFDCDAYPEMKQFFKHYISTHQKAS